MRLDNPQDKESIEETLRIGQETEFWKVIQEGVETNIKHLQTQLDSSENDELPADEYKSKMQNLRYRKKIWGDMLELPQLLIALIQKPNQEEPDLDVYD